MFNNQMLFDRRMTVRMDRDADRTETRASRCGLPEGLRSIGMGLGSRGDPLHDVPRKYLLCFIYCGLVNLFYILLLLYFFLFACFCLGGGSGVDFLFSCEFVLQEVVYKTVPWIFIVIALPWNLAALAVE